MSCLIDLLPAELVLAVLSHIDPLSQDPAAVRATCRSWRRFLRDERLWRQFHARVYPTRLPGDETTKIEAHDALVMGGAQTWRQSFADKTGRLKNALAKHRTESKSDYEGLEWCLVAAASEGCVPLVRRFADALRELLASRGLEPADGLASLVADNQRPSPQRTRGNVLHMALCGACVAHSAATVKVPSLFIYISGIFFRYFS